MTALIALTWLRRFAVSIPWFAYALAGLIAALAISHHSARAWHRRYDVAQASIDALAKAQRAANFAAVANKARVETAQIIVTKEKIVANVHAHAVAGDATAALRLRIADLERAAKLRAVSGVSGSAAVADAQVDLRLPLTDELALRNECEAQRIDRDSLIDTVTGWAAVDRVSPLQ